MPTRLKKFDPVRATRLLLLLTGSLTAGLSTAFYLPLSRQATAVQSRSTSLSSAAGGSARPVKVMQRVPPFQQSAHLPQRTPAQVTASPAVPRVVSSTSVPVITTTQPS